MLKKTIFILSYQRLDSIGYLMRNLLDTIGDHRDKFNIVVLDNKSALSDDIRKIWKEQDIDGYIFTKKNIAFSLIYHGIKLVCPTDYSCAVLETDRVFLPRFKNSFHDIFNYFDVTKDAFYLSLSRRGDSLVELLRLGSTGQRKTYGKIVENSIVNGNIVWSIPLYLYFTEKYGLALQDSMVHRIVTEYGLTGLGYFCTTDIGYLTTLNPDGYWLEHAYLEDIEIEEMKLPI